MDFKIIALNYIEGMWHFDTDFTDFVKNKKKTPKNKHMLSFQALTSET